MHPARHPPSQHATIVTPQSQPSVPQQQRLALIAQARKVVLESRAPLGQPLLAPWVERSWRRCLDLGLEPRQHISFDTVTSTAAHHAIEANQPLLRAVRLGELGTRHEGLVLPEGSPNHCRGSGRNQQHCGYPGRPGRFGFAGGRGGFDD